MNDDNEINIKQIDPPKELNNEEKKAIAIFEMERADEELSKTMQFKKLNTRLKDDYIELALPNELEDTILPEEKKSLTDTIRLKISELRSAIEEEQEIINIPKKSLYDTVIIKLDDLINNKKALRNYKAKKVTETETLKKKRFRLFAKNITKENINDIKINVNSNEFGRQLYNLNKIALTFLSQNYSMNTREYSSEISRLNKIEKVHVSKINYLQYQRQLNSFAINKLYYKLAPKETNKYKLYRASVILSSIVFTITSIIVINWFIQGVHINKISYSLQEEAPIEYVEEGEIYTTVEDVEELQTEEEKDMYWKYLNTPLSSIDFTHLLEENPETVGWLIVNNTNVNYPVVQTTDNNYYLKHAFDGSNNNAGWVFADFRSNFDNLSNNTVIYAHGRKDRVMFGSLIDTLNEEWYKNPDNQIIQLSTLNNNTMWQIVSIYKIPAESYYITTDFSSDASFETFISTIKERSIYNFNININKDDKILTLSTCYNDSGIRLVLHAKLVKQNPR